MNNKKYNGLRSISNFFPKEVKDLLHKRGWNGINVDLDAKSIQLFNLARSKDININTAVSSGKFTKDLYFYHDKSAINTIEKQIADYQSPSMLDEKYQTFCGT